MKIVLVGHDMAPSKAFATLMEVYLKSPTDSVDAFLAHAKRTESHSDERVRAKVDKADFVLCGISQPAANAAMEITAARAAQTLGIPFGFYADTTGAWKREVVAEFREDASLIMTVLGSERELSEAREMFPHATIVCTGNPLWETYFLPASREEVRAHAGFSDDEFVILSPGTKEPVITIRLWAAVMEAAGSMDMAKRATVILTQHPGDQTPPEIYQLLVDYAPALGVRLVGPGKMPSDDLVPGVDAVVGNMNASVLVHAICRRIGTVDFYDHCASIRLNLIGGGTFGQHLGTGAVLDVYTASPVDLRMALEHIEQKRDLLRAKQELVHPQLKQGEAVENMRKAIAGVLDSR